MTTRTNKDFDARLSAFNEVRALIDEFWDMGGYDRPTLLKLLMGIHALVSIDQLERDTKETIIKRHKNIIKELSKNVD